MLLAPAGSDCGVVAQRCIDTKKAIIMKFLLPIFTRASVAALTLGATACSGESTDYSDDARAGSQNAALYYIGAAGHWPKAANRGGSVLGADINACWDVSALPLADQATGKQLATNVITWANASWGAAADVNFWIDVDSPCGNSASRNGKLVIKVNNTNTTNCQFYRGTGAPTVMNLALGSSKTTAIHEVGHALGFPHEFERSDWMHTSGIACNTDADCTSAPNDGNYGSHCVKLTPTATKKYCRDLSSEGINVTTSADFDSMMAATYTLNNLADRTGQLSPSDIAGVQSVYGVDSELSWYGWNSLNKNSNLPVAGAAFNGSIHLFAVNTDGTYAHSATVDGQPFALWDNAISGTTNQAVATTAFANRLYIFAKGGQNGAVYSSSAAQGQSFSPWANTISGTTNLPLATAALGSRLYLFRVTSSNQIMVTSATAGNAFGAWAQIDGSTNAAVATASLGNNLYVAAKDSGNSRVYIRSAADGQPFGTWADMGETTNVAPAMAVVQHGASGGNDRLLLLRVGTDGRIYYRIAQDGSAFGGWYEIPGGATTNVAVGAARLGAYTYVFATGTDGQVRVNGAHL